MKNSAQRNHSGAVADAARRRTLGLLRWAAIAATAAVLVGENAGAARAPKREERDASDYKAYDMLNKGTDLIKARQEERGLKLISSIPSLFPKSDVRFQAYMVLGKHQEEKREFDAAVRAFEQVEESEEEDLQAEALYHIGICYYNMSRYDKAFMTLRKVTNEFPWTVYANEAFYYIGLCHFKLGHWAKAVEALEMVGTSVPSAVDEEVYAEAGQRFWVKLLDKDLVVLKESGEVLNIDLHAASGDRETVAMSPLGRGGEYYLASIPSALGPAVTNDGVLQIAGMDTVQLEYIDTNTESGQRNKKRLSTVKMVSTARIGFTDGAYREYTHGVFGDSDCFFRVKDLDRDVSNEKDRIKIRVQTRYKVKKDNEDESLGVDLSEEEEVRVRDQMTLTLQESAEHSGVFVGSCMPVIVPNADNIDQGDDTLSAMEGDTIMFEYYDELHIGGRDPRTLTAEAPLLVGEIEDVKVEHRVVDSIDIKAKKDLIEAQIFLKLGQIFKEVGLNDNAYEKAGEGLDRVEEVIRTSLKASLDRQIVEEAFQIKWDLLLVQDKLEEAIDVCNSLTRLFPDSTLVDQALLKIGMAKMESGNGDGLNEAISIFNSIIRLEQSDLKAEAAFRIAEIYERRAEIHAKRYEAKPDLSRAMLAYKQCAESYPDSVFAGDALEKIINFYINNKDYARSIRLMERVTQDYPDASFLDRILLKWGIAAYRSNDRETAIRKLDQLLSEYPDSQLAEKASQFKAVIEGRGD